MHQPIDTPDNPVPSLEQTVATVARALAKLTYEERRGNDPKTRIDETTYAAGLIRLYMGEWAPKPSSSGLLCPFSILVGRALMNAAFIRATAPEDEGHIVRGEQ